MTAPRINEGPVILEPPALPDVTALPIAPSASPAVAILSEVSAAIPAVDRISGTKRKRLEIKRVDDQAKRSKVSRVAFKEINERLFFIKGESIDRTKLPEEYETTDLIKAKDKMEEKVGAFFGRIEELEQAFETQVKTLDLTQIDNLKVIFDMAREMKIIVVNQHEKLSNELMSLSPKIEITRDMNKGIIKRLKITKTFRKREIDKRMRYAGIEALAYKNTIVDVVLDLASSHHDLSSEYYQTLVEMLAFAITSPRKNVMLPGEESVSTKVAKAALQLASCRNLSSDSRIKISKIIIDEINAMPLRESRMDDINILLNTLPILVSEGLDNGDRCQIVSPIISSLRAGDVDLRRKDFLLTALSRLITATNFIEESHGKFADSIISVIQAQIKAQIQELERESTQESRIRFIQAEIKKLIQADCEKTKRQAWIDEAGVQRRILAEIQEQITKDDKEVPIQLWREEAEIQKRILAWIAAEDEDDVEHIVDDIDHSIEYSKNQDTLFRALLRMMSSCPPSYISGIYTKVAVCAIEAIENSPVSEKSKRADEDKQKELLSTIIEFCPGFISGDYQSLVQEIFVAIQNCKQPERTEKERFFVEMLTKLLFRDNIPELSSKVYNELAVHVINTIVSADERADEDRQKKLLSKLLLIPGFISEDSKKVFRAIFYAAKDLKNNDKLEFFIGLLNKLLSDKRLTESDKSYADAILNILRGVLRSLIRQKTDGK